MIFDGISTSQLNKSVVLFKRLTLPPETTGHTRKCFHQNWCIASKRDHWPWYELLRNDAEIFPLWCELQLNTMVNKNTFRSPKFDVCRHCSIKRGRTSWQHMWERINQAYADPLLSPSYTPGERRGSPRPLLRTPSALRHFCSAITSKRKKVIDPQTCQST